MRDFKHFKARMLKNKAVKKKYDELGPEFALISLLIKKRTEKGLTQEQLARKIGTKQSAIARLESGRYNPTLNAMKKVAEALGARFEIAIR